jgi:hypothetical protein
MKTGSFIGIGTSLKVGWSWTMQQQREAKIMETRKSKVTAGMGQTVTKSKVN